MKDLLHVIVNEKIFRKKKNFYCENKDIQSIVNYLTDKYNLLLISRHSYSIKSFKLKKVYKIFNIKLINFFYFLFEIFINFFKKKKILIISITPFNFFIFFLFKFFFNCKFYLYLRSDGYKEYENILGKKYVWIYDCMFKYITKHSDKIISCHKKLYNKQCYIVHPSEINFNWNKRTKKNNYKLNRINLLYVGRFKIEKGIYSLLNIFSKLPKNIKLTLVGNGDLIKKTDKNIKIFNFIKNENTLINLYDSSNILILPSYTEAHPKVIDEALSRMRPVIIFDDIKHVVNKRYGVFLTKRDPKKFIKTINFIKENNKLINYNLKKNKLPLKNNFLDDLNKILCIN